jgi:hypothetical protein
VAHLVVLVHGVGQILDIIPAVVPRQHGRVVVSPAQALRRVRQGAVGPQYLIALDALLVYETAVKEPYVRLAGNVYAYVGHLDHLSAYYIRKKGG